MKIFSERDYVHIKFSIIEKILGIHGSFKISISDMQDIHDLVPIQSWRELKMPGTFLPGIIKAGTYMTDRGREFWYVTRKKYHIVIELRRGFYKRIILSVDDKDTIDQIKENL